MSEQAALHSFPEFHLGDRLRKAREATGLDAKAFSAEIGVSRESLRKYEAGTTTPRRPVLVAVAMRTGFTVDQLTGADHSPDTSPDHGKPPTEWKTASGLAEIVELRGIRPVRQDVAAA
jgi:transcriptional regulator with XRE-family HTH domain